jgi:hypothetical protein
MAEFKITTQLVRGMRQGLKEFGVSRDDIVKAIQRHLVRNSDYMKGDINDDFLIPAVAMLDKFLMVKHDEPQRAPVLKIPHGHTAQPYIKRSAYAGQDEYNPDAPFDPNTDIVFVNTEDHRNFESASEALRTARSELTPEQIAQYEKVIQDIQQKYGKLVYRLSVQKGQDMDGFQWANSTDPVWQRHIKDKGIQIVKESAFDQFDNLPLAEQLELLSKVDKKKIDEAWSAKYKKSINCSDPKGFSQKAHCAGKKKKNETIEAEQDMAALLTSYGTPKKKKKKAKGFEHPNKSGNKVKEGAVPVHNTKRDYNEIMNKPLLGSDIKAQMQAYFVVPDPSMVREFRAQIATAGKNVDLRPVFKAFADRQLHPKEKKQVSESVIAESRGVTARQPGEQYISDSNPQDILTIQSIDIFPNDGNPAYDSVEQLQSVLDKAVPDNGMRIDDNNPTAGSKAAIVATVSTEQGDDQYWVRFIKSIPPSGVDNLWKTLRGYKYSKGASRESIPVKPSDMVTPNAYITTDQIASDVDHNATTKFAGTEHDALVAVLNDAVSKARANDTSPIENASKYFNVLQKYAGEYLGPLSLIDGGNLKGDTAKMLEAYGLTTLAGSTIMFPDDTAYPLVDSIIRTPDGKEIGISSKAHTGGGATSSLSGVVNQLTPEIEQRYPRGTAIMKLLGTSPTKLGPVLAARQLGVLTDQDVEDFKTVPLDSKDLKSITNQTLYNIAANQGVQDEAHPNYRVFFRLLAGIVNIIIPMINSDQEFIDAMKETLNNNNFIQVLQKGKKVGDGVSMDYYTKYPAVFEGAPKLVNKGYAATMAKDRLGFKLKK